MLCPYCSHPETKVTDKRDAEAIIKRRRECLKCSERFTTHELVERADLWVIKKDGRRELFDREKVRKGILRACEKRPVGVETITMMIQKIEEAVRKKGSEVRTVVVGELVSRELKKIDSVAYVRFASVYKNFSDLSDFKSAIQEMVKR
ncbi:MAG TPA: transcriptional regulator NrdR [Candidatus Nanoarchaeia archaeon]|nr:transcriptional regulator NrdR [Candidatus Nanoarchaeia archaeon]